MADGEIKQKRSLSRTSTVNVFAAMEDINDKLKILNYETEFCRKRNFKPLTRISFAVQVETMQQFPYFSALVAWLLSECKVHDFIPWTEFDNPATVSNSIVTQVRSLEADARTPLSSFNPAKLRQGHGEAVVIVLDFLCSYALQKQNFQVEPPVYQTQEYAEAAPVDEAAEIGEEEIVEEEQVEEGGYEDMGYFSSEKNGIEEKKATQDIVESTVDPVQWRLQLETVGPRLKFKPRADALEWRTHLEQSQKHQKQISSHAPDAIVSLRKMGAQLNQVVERIATKERHINQEFDHLGQDFRQKQKKLDEVTEYYNKLTVTVADYTNELQSKGDEIEMIRAQMDTRNKEFTDPSPLRAITAALSTLKTEVAAMELRIGILKHTLLHSKVRSPHE